MYSVVKWPPGAFFFLHKVQWSIMSKVGQGDKRDMNRTKDDNFPLQNGKFVNYKIHLESIF